MSNKTKIEAMLRTATEEAKASAKLTDFRYKLLTKFLTQAEAEWGIGPEQFSVYIKQTLDMCMQKQDVKTAEKVLGLWHSLMFAPDSNVKNLLSSANSLLRIEAKTEPEEDQAPAAPKRTLTKEQELEAIEAQLAQSDD